MVLERPGKEFHVAVWRDGQEKLGLKLAVHRDILRVDAITGSRIIEANQRCRSCRLEQVVQQQLLENDQVVSVNGQTELKGMLAELNDVKVECCHLRVRRHPQEAQAQDQHPPAARPPQALRPGPPHLQTVGAGIEEMGPRSLPMQTPNGTPVPVSMPPSATPQGAQHTQSADFSETASVLTVRGTENFAATAQAAGPQPQMPNGTGPYQEPAAPRAPAVPAGPPAVEHQQPAGAASTAASAAAPAALAPRGSRVITNYDPPNEPENGYLGVVAGTMVTVQPGSRTARAENNRFDCDYVFAWKTDHKEHRGWLPVAILDSLAT
eukprot:TRINITY_DN2628_c0_g1_i1.p1 TRINITY_DN2628_c0_g1~~TRINITY_DN2628_c0_g1_i1.p1  ORF type:complete len:334 (+),score=56.94 TRINITY_DN2628_c0_g1_i1:36-1004(+)